MMVMTKNCDGDSQNDCCCVYLKNTNNLAPYGLCSFCRWLSLSLDVSTMGKSSTSQHPLIKNTVVLFARKGKPGRKKAAIGGGNQTAE